MTRLLRSIALRFPFLLAVIVLAVALVSGRVAQTEMQALLWQNVAEELGAGANQVATMLTATLPSSQQALMQTASDARLREALAPAQTEPRARQLLEATLRTRPGETRLAARLLRPDGSVRAATAVQAGATSMGWTALRIREGALQQDAVNIGPIVSIADTMPGFVVVTPVRSAEGQLLGWLEEVHSGRGRGAADIRRLIDVQRLVLGTPDWTVWTDFEGIIAGPEMTAELDSVQRLVGASGAGAIGVGRRVNGTPWVVWVDRAETEVMAPIQRVLRRIWSAALFIGVLGALLAWLLARYYASRIRNVAGELDRTLNLRGSQPTEHRNVDDELRVLEESYAALEARVAQSQRLDEQVLQARKLEAVGRLAGGIAHDFNNLLTVMGAYGTMVRDRLAADSMEAADMDELLKATERATALTRQLLAFSRQRIADVRPLDLNEVVRGTDGMLARLIPSNVERNVELATDLPPVFADSNHLEQVLINLVVNAVDAMPDGGRLVIRTARASVDALPLPGGGLTGVMECVCLSVSDTGVGMDAQTLSRVFDPFFTTKAHGKGTGLGLATVHGIVHDAGGRVLVRSAIGEGTTMQVCLPALALGAQAPTRGTLPITGSPLAHGRVLVAEDDDAARSVMIRVLESAGHEVLAFATADAALSWLENSAGQEPLLAAITDVMMPGMNGIAFVATLRARFPKLPVVLVSGYADVQERLPDDLPTRPVILEKPFTASALHDALRRAVQQASGS